LSSPYDHEILLLVLMIPLIRLAGYREIPTIPLRPPHGQLKLVCQSRSFTGGFDKHYSTTLFWDAKPLHSLETEYFMMTVVWWQNSAIDAPKISDLESFSELKYIVKYIVRGTSPSISRPHAVSVLPIVPLFKPDLTPATAC
jgi:hypothetical protein